MLYHIENMLEYASMGVENISAKGLGVVSVLVGIIVMMLIGIITITAVITSQGTGGKTGWSTNANSTWTTLQSNVWTAFTLLVILPIIIGAAAILAYLKFG